MHSPFIYSFQFIASYDSDIQTTKFINDLSTYMSDHIMPDHHPIGQVIDYICARLSSCQTSHRRHLGRSTIVLDKSLSSSTISIPLCRIIIVLDHHSRPSSLVMDHQSSQTIMPSLYCYPISRTSFKLKLIDLWILS